MAHYRGCHRRHAASPEACWRAQRHSSQTLSNWQCRRPQVCQHLDVLAERGVRCTPPSPYFVRPSSAGASWAYALSDRRANCASGADARHLRTSAAQQRCCALSGWWGWMGEGFPLVATSHSPPSGTFLSTDIEYLNHQVEEYRDTPHRSRTVRTHILAVEPLCPTL